MTTATIIKVDFKRRTYHKPAPVVPEEIAKTIYESSIGWVDTSPSEMIPFGGAGIDGMNLDPK